MKQMRKNITMSAVILIFLFGIFNINIEVFADYTVNWYETLEDIELKQGNNWFEIELKNDDGISSHDIYFEVILDGSYQGLYTELYYNNKSTPLTGDYRDFTSNYCMVHQSAKTGWYYLNIYFPAEIGYATITTDKYAAADDEYEPNNRFHFAEPLELTTDTIITGDLGHYGEDVDFYAYMATEPCMLSVDLYDDSSAELSIYVGNSLVASTDSWEATTASNKIRSFPYRFNHTHGICYFKVYGGYDGYKLRIKKDNYQATPVLYNISPTKRRFYSEFDILTPKIATLANGKLSTSYFHVRNGESYHSIDGEIEANDKTFTEFQFPDLLPSQVSNSGDGKQNDIQFMAKNMTGIGASQTVSVVLNYDNAPPECSDVILETSEDSIEVTVLKAYDLRGLAQKPYRYRIYPSGETAPEYSEWLTKNYYYMGIENGTELSAGVEYTVDVQIRDNIAENCQDSSQNLNNHITTITKTVQIG